MKCIASYLSCKATHDNELVQEMHGNIVMNCNIFTNLLDKTQRHVIMPLFRKAPGTIYRIFRPKLKVRSLTKLDSREACIIEYTIIMHYLTSLTREERSS